MKPIDRPLSPFCQMSRYALASWFVPFVGKRKELQELSTGEDYCTILAKLFPAAVEVKKIKRVPRNDLERIQNWKIFQRALTTLKVNKNVPILALIRPNAAIMLEFCRWFVTFIEENHNEEVNKPKKAKSLIGYVRTTNNFVNQRDQLTQKESASDTMKTLSVVSQINELDKKGSEPMIPKKTELLDKKELDSQKGPEPVKQEESEKELEPDQPTQKESKTGTVSPSDIFFLVTPRTRQREEQIVMNTAKEQMQLEMTPPLSTSFDSRIRESPKPDRLPINVPPSKRNDLTPRLDFDQTPRRDTPIRRFAESPSTAADGRSPGILSRWQLPSLSQAQTPRRLNFDESDF